MTPQSVASPGRMPNARHCDRSSVAPAVFASATIGTAWTVTLVLADANFVVSGCAVARSDSEPLASPTLVVNPTLTLTVWPLPASITDGALQPLNRVVGH